MHAGERSGDAARFDDEWTFVGGGRIADLRVDPAPAAAGYPLRVRLSAEGLEGCAVEVEAWPPIPQSRQEIWRGVATLAHLPPDDARVVRAAMDAEGVAVVDLPDDWFARSVVLQARTTCAGKTRAVQSGPRREAVVEGRLVEGAVAVLAVVPTSSVPLSVDVPRTDTPIEIDGVADERIWQQRRRSLVQSLDGEPLPPDAHPTEVAFAWDDEALYALFVATDADAWSEFVADDSPLWERDVVELFVGAVPMTHYVELHVSPRGTRFSARFRGRRTQREAWGGAWRAAVSLHGTIDDDSDRDERWVVELAVPWTALSAAIGLDGPPAPGRQLRANAYRMDRARGGRVTGSALGPTYVPDFHALERAPVLTLR